MDLWRGKFRTNNRTGSLTAGDLKSIANTREISFPGGGHVKIKDTVELSADVKAPARQG